jgi:hypothetical protein
MRPKLMRMIAALAAAVLLVTWPVPASPPAQSPRGPGENYSAIPSARASTFLAEIRNETAELLADIQRETAELSPHPYTSRNLPWGPQSDWQKRDPFLDRAKGHMNAVGERIKKLQHIRAFVLPWQQLAITEVTSHAAQVAASIQAVIVHLRENENRLFVSTYRDHLTTIAAHTEKMKHTVDKFLDNEKIPKEVHRLQTELESAGD